MNLSYLANKMHLDDMTCIEPSNLQRYRKQNKLLLERIYHQIPWYIGIFWINILIFCSVAMKCNETLEYGLTLTPWIYVWNTRCVYNCMATDESILLIWVPIGLPRGTGLSMAGTFLMSPTNLISSGKDKVSYIQMYNVGLEQLILMLLYLVLRGLIL